MATFDEFYKSLPKDSGKRGEFFEKVFVPWFLKTDPEWFHKIRSIWLWDEYPYRWGKDCGIDLVYEDNNGNHWAVQSKCVAPDREISKAEIDSFLSESNDPRFHGRLLIASTDGIGKNAQQVIERQEKQVICFLREHFAQSAVEFPSSPDNISTGRRKNPLTPRPHQEEAIRNVVAGLQIHERGQLLMACGTGKTLTALWIKEELRSQRTLVLVPSLSLLSQTLREWTANSREPFNWICVCSDRSVAKQDRTTDDWIEHTNELGAPVTSDPEEIRRFLHGEEGGVVFCTYQSSPLIAEAQTDQNTPAFDLALADEAHRCAGKVSPAFGCILDGTQIRSSKRLFMTATPRILSYQLKSKANIANIAVASMDDNKIFGVVFHCLNFSEAIDAELLTDYRVVAIGIDDNDIKEKIDHRVLATIDGQETTDYETLAQHIAVSMVVKEYDLQRVISFHGKIKGAKRFAEDHPRILEWLPENRKTNKQVHSEYVSGGMTALERNRKIDRLRQLSSEEAGILSNARCLSEGVDVPALDGIVFIDPRSSQVDIIQAVGRAIRLSDSKKYGYIVIPVYIGDTSNAEEEIILSRYNKVWNVILALRTQDNSLAEVIDRLRVEFGKRGESRVKDPGLEKIIFLPEKIERTVGDALRTILVRSTSDDWYQYYGQLLEYVNKEGNARVKQKYPTLGWWVGDQRTDYNRSILSEEKVDLLESLNGWCWDAKEAWWQDKYNELKEYARINGHATPSLSNPVFGSWINHQRTKYAKGELDPQRAELLEQLPGWKWNIKDTQWQERFEKLAVFANRNGHASPIVTEPIIGRWVATQRSKRNNGILQQDGSYLYKGQKISAEECSMLESLPGWQWKPFNDKWRNNYEALAKYYLKNGTYPSSEENMTLDRWVKKQRTNYQRGTLSAEKINLLESLDEWAWNALDTDWENRYQELVRFTRRNGHARPPRNHATLGSWVQRQRRNFSEQKLCNERVKLLESLDGWAWNAVEDHWQEQYNLLVEFLNEHGHTRVPRIKKNSSLISWINRQRHQYNAGEMTEDRIQKLESLEGWLWEVRMPGWQEKYNELVKYSQNMGEARPPNDHPTLGGWVRWQRQNYKHNRLEKMQIEALENLPGWTWNMRESNWEENYQALKEYAQKVGHARPPQRYPVLGRWVALQRTDYLEQKITEERINLLESLTGWVWNTRNLPKSQKATR